MRTTTHVLTYNGSASTASFDLPPGPEALVLVIDWIRFLGQSVQGATPGAGASAGIFVRRNDSSHDIFRKRIMIPQTPVSATIYVNVETDFFTGLPCYHDAMINASGSQNLMADHVNGSAWTGVEVGFLMDNAGSGQSFTNLAFTVGYHYEDNATRRSANIGP